MIQNIYDCKDYTPNDNLNLTCKNNKRCEIYYDNVCRDYEVKDARCNMFKGKA